jgi:nickel superoxide dismutase
MIVQISNVIRQLFPAQTVSAHCDGPCGVYDPADARIKAEAVLSMSKKIDALKDNSDFASMHTISRYIAIKEGQAHKCKQELLVLWTDFFKPQHLEAHPDLHDVFWQAAKLCSACKVENSVENAKKLMETVEKIHNIFWSVKNREVTYYTAS